MNNKLHIYDDSLRVMASINIINVLSMSLNHSILRHLADSLTPVIYPFTYLEESEIKPEDYDIKSLTYSGSCSLSPSEQPEKDHLNRGIKVEGYIIL